MSATSSSTENNFDISGLNEFIQNANTNLECGTECQTERQTAKLQEEMYKAQQNMQTAPEEYEKATQAYLTFTKGESEYNTYHEEQLQKQAKVQATQLREKLSQKLAKLNQSTELNTSLVMSANNQAELLGNYQDDHVQAQNNVNYSSADIVTNERKSYYEDQIISSQNFYTTMMTYMYMGLLVVYVLAAIFHSNGVSWTTHIMILVFFALYYTLGKYLLQSVVYLFQYVRGLFPTNVYFKLQEPTDKNHTALKNLANLNNLNMKEIALTSTNSPMPAFSDPETLSSLLTETVKNPNGVITSCTVLMTNQTDNYSFMNGDYLFSCSSPDSATIPSNQKVNIYQMFYGTNFSDIFLTANAYQDSGNYYGKEVTAVREVKETSTSTSSSSSQKDLVTVSVSGEWIQIQIPYKLFVTGYSLNTNNMNYLPSSYYFCGSNDGTTWFRIDSKTSLSSSSNLQNFVSLSNPPKVSFTYFRVICQKLPNKISGAGNSMGVCVGIQGKHYIIV